jgi:hypothetical protein
MKPLSCRFFFGTFALVIAISLVVVFAVIGIQETFLRKTAEKPPVVSTGRVTPTVSKSAKYTVTYTYAKPGGYVMTSDTETTDEIVILNSGIQFRNSTGKLVIVSNYVLIEN